MNKFTRACLYLLLCCTGLFAVTFVVYFFNIDMKLTSKIEPLLIKHYDRIDRDQHL